MRLWGRGTALALLVAYSVLAATQWMPLRHDHGEDAHRHFAGTMPHGHGHAHVHGAPAAPWEDPDQGSEDDHQPGVGGIHFVPALPATPAESLPAVAVGSCSEPALPFLPENAVLRPRQPRAPPAGAAA